MFYLKFLGVTVGRTEGNSIRCGGDFEGGLGGNSICWWGSVFLSWRIYSCAGHSIFRMRNLWQDGQLGYSWWVRSRKAIIFMREWFVFVENHSWFLGSSWDGDRYTWFIVNVGVLMESQIGNKPKEKEGNCYNLSQNKINHRSYL